MQLGQLRRPGRSQGTTRWSRSTWAAAHPASSTSASRAVVKAAASSRMRSSWSPAWSTSATARTLACHPASTTHRQLSPEELAKGRRIGRHDPPVGRHRAHRRHHRRPRPGAERRLTRRQPPGTGRVPGFVPARRLPPATLPARQCRGDNRKTSPQAGEAAMLTRSETDRPGHRQPVRNGAARKATTAPSRSSPATPATSVRPLADHPRFGQSPCLLQRYCDQCRRPLRPASPLAAARRTTRYHARPRTAPA